MNTLTAGRTPAAASEADVSARKSRMSLAKPGHELVLHNNAGKSIMRIRSLLGAAAAAVLLAAGITSSAGAVPTPSEIEPRTGQPTTSRGYSASAVSPSVSPYAPSGHYSDGAPAPCDEGNLCARVWDRTTNSWEVFWFDACATYSLSNWEGGGPYYNNQTGGKAVASFYRQNGTVLDNVYPGEDGWQDWSPVWKIRNCYA